MKVTVQQQVDFRPEWGDNHKLPASEQVVVTLRTPTVAERQRYCGIDLSATVMGAVHTPRVDIRVDHISLVRRHVVEIRNLTVTIENTDKDIRTGEDIVNTPGVHDLVVEIGREISDLTAQVRGVNPRSVGPGAPGSEDILGARRLPEDG